MEVSTSITVTTMTIAISRLREDGTGRIEVWTFPDASEFDKKMAEMAPSSEEDWEALAQYIEKHGKKICQIVPDFSLSVRFD